MSQIGSGLSNSDPSLYAQQEAAKKADENQSQPGAKAAQRKATPPSMQRAHTQPGVSADKDSLSQHSPEHTTATEHRSPFGVTLAPASAPAGVMSSQPSHQIARRAAKSANDVIGSKAATNQPGEAAKLFQRGVYAVLAGEASPADKQNLLALTKHDEGLKLIYLEGKGTRGAATGEGFVYSHSFEHGAAYANRLQRAGASAPPDHYVLCKNFLAALKALIHNTSGSAPSHPASAAEAKFVADVQTHFGNSTANGYGPLHREMFAASMPKSASASPRLGASVGGLRLIAKGEAFVLGASGSYSFAGANPQTQSDIATFYAHVLRTHQELTATAGSARPAVTLTVASNEDDAGVASRLADMCRLIEEKLAELP